MGVLIVIFSWMVNFVKLKTVALWLTVRVLVLVTMPIICV